MGDTPNPPNPAQWQAYLREPCVLLNHISMVAHHVAATTTIPRLWRVVREPYGLFKNKKREVRVDAGQWELKKVRTYWCRQKVCTSRGSGEITDYEMSETQTYCLDTDGTLFSFNYHSEAGVEQGQWHTFANEEGEHIPFTANIEDFLTIFDWDATAKTATTNQEEIIRSPEAVFRAVEQGGQCGLVWCSADGPSQQKGAGLLSVLQAMLV